MDQLPREPSLGISKPWAFQAESMKGDQSFIFHVVLGWFVALCLKEEKFNFPIYFQALGETSYWFSLSLPFRMPVLLTKILRSLSLSAQEAAKLSSRDLMTLLPTGPTGVASN